MTSRTVAVVGAGLAGLRAAEQLRTAGWTERILVVGAEAHPPYNRPPLTKGALANGVDPTKLAFRQRPTTADVEWRLGTRVEAADLRTRELVLADGSRLEYDGLVIASGVSSRRLNLAAPESWRHSLRTVEDAERLHSALHPGSRVVIIGGGFIGCEVACTAVGIGAQATIVEPCSVPLEGPSGALVGAEVQRRHEERGVTFHTGLSVVTIEGDPADGPSTVVLDDGTRLEADIVVEAVGSRANTAWLAGQGLDLADGVLCDGDLHPVTSEGPVRNVVALGDVARFPVPMFGGTAMRIEHWTMPTDCGPHAARSLIAEVTGVPAHGPTFNPVPTFWSEQWGTRLQCFGVPALGREDVRVLAGDLAGEAVVGYHRDGRLVGVLLFGMTKQMVTYRRALVEANPIVPAGDGRTVA